MKTRPSHTIQITLAAALFCTVFTGRLSAQGIAFDYLNQTNVNALFNADGQLFWNGKKANFEVPKGSGKSTISAGGIWIAGYDNVNGIHAAAQTYRESGADFQPGPLDTATGRVDNATITAYNKVWRVTKAQIDSFKAGLSVPAAILNWPGNGDTAKGYAKKMAPFVDLNGNGIYEPNKGEYPDIKGDVMLWWVYNDATLYHSKTQAFPLYAEVQVSAYTYNCPGDPILSNTVFMDYKLINRSANTYTKVNLGLFADLDIGNIFDDYVGCDTATNTFFGYNSTDHDRDTVIITKGSSYSYKGYGTMLPAQSVTFLKGIAGDNGKEMRMSRFMYYNNADNVPQGNPNSPNDFVNLLTGHWLNGTPLTTGGSGYGGATAANYAFPGEPGDRKTWNELAGHDTAGDRRGLGIFGPFTFAPGQAKEFTVAFGFHQDPSGKNLQSLQLMRDQVKALTQEYQKGAITTCTGLATCTTGDSCVWPGDANDDRAALGDDLFRIGYAYGTRGPARLMASPSWNPQAANPWSRTFPDGENFKYADCNGDGVIDSQDVVTLFNNFSLTHSKSGGANAATASVPTVAVSIDQDTVAAGGVVTGKILIADSTIGIGNAFGISLDINFDPSVMDPSSFQMSLDSSDLGKLNQLLALVKTDPASGTTHISVSRQDSSGKAIHKTFIAFKYVVADDLAGYHKEEMNENHVIVVDSRLKPVTINTQNASVVLVPVVSGVKYIDLSGFMNLYPNPAQTAVNVDMGRYSAATIQIFNMEGQMIKTIITPPGQTQAHIDIADFPTGLYVMDINTSHGLAVKKFSKTN